MLAAKFGATCPISTSGSRLLIEAEARSLGHGGISAVARAARVREVTVSLGLRELDSGDAPLGRLRRADGSRKRRKYGFSDETSRHHEKWRTVSRPSAGAARGGAGMSLRWRIAVIVLAAAGVVSTPMIWLLGSPDAGQLVGASVQAAVGIAALVWAWFQRPGNRTDDTAMRTGAAEASDGGSAVTGIRRPQGRGSGSAKAERTGNSTATGGSSSAVSGIDYT